MKIENINEEILRDLYLRKLALGEIQGPPTGKRSIDKPWLKYYSEDSIEKVLPEKTIYEYLYDSNKKYLNRTALNYYGRKISFDELFRNIDKTANALLANGVEKGDIVTISMPTLPETVYLFYALSKIGAISNMIDPRTSEQGIKSYLQEVNSKLCIAINVAKPKFEKIINETNVEKFVTISPADSLPLLLKLGYIAKENVTNLKTKKIDTEKKVINCETANWSEFIKQANAYEGNIHFDYEKDYPVAIVHTGGTTGMPKGVILSNDSLNAAAFQCQVSGIDMQREHTWLNIMPPFIAYGIGNGLHLPLVIGMETVLVPQFDPKKFDELLLKHKPNHMVGVPSHYENIIESKKLQKEDLSYIIAPTVGGDTMNIELEKKVNKFLIDHNCKDKITKGYGMTEVNAAVSVCTSNECNRLGSVGIPVPKTIISVFDLETGEELGDKQEGEICITGPNTMTGYYKNKKATEQILKKHKDGKIWVHSGDIGYMDDGFVYIVDRLKRIIIRHDGFKIFPSMIENVISLHPNVDDCKVVGIADIEHTQGSLAKAHIILKDKINEEQTINEIKTLCQAELPEYAIPIDYKVRDTMPLTPIGKVDFISLQNEDKEIKNNTGKVLHK